GASCEGPLDGLKLYGHADSTGAEGEEPGPDSTLSTLCHFFPDSAGEHPATFLPWTGGRGAAGAPVVKQPAPVRLRHAPGVEGQRVVLDVPVDASGRTVRSPTRLAEEQRMYLHVQRLINEIVPDEPDPAAANALQEGLGGQFGEMRTMMQYLFQSFNFRGKAAKPFRDLLHGVGTEEISHVELIATTIARLTDGSPRYQGSPTELDEPAAGG